MTDINPYAYIATKDGMWCGLLAHDCGNGAEAKSRWLKDEVGPQLGEWMADGCTIITVYSREEYNQKLKEIPMWEKPQLDLFVGKPA